MKILEDFKEKIKGCSIAASSLHSRTSIAFPLGSYRPFQALDAFSRYCNTAERDLSDTAWSQGAHRARIQSVNLSRLVCDGSVLSCRSLPDSMGCFVDAKHRVP